MVMDGMKHKLKETTQIWTNAVTPITVLKRMIAAQNIVIPAPLHKNDLMYMHIYGAYTYCHT